MNPYLNRAMIRNSADFFGRSSEVTRILSRAGADPPQSVSIVGERRIGKSSLLFHLAESHVRERVLGDVSDLVVVFFDCQQFRQFSVDEFFHMLKTRIMAACRLTDSEVETFRRSSSVTPWPALPTRPPSARQDDSSDSTNKSLAYFDFQALLDQLQAGGRKLVLLLDEFDAVTSNSVFGPEFFSFLRSMANNYPLAYVTTSKTELQRLCYSSEISDSPFFNIFSNLYLKPLTHEEAVELITVPSKKVEVPLDEFQDEIIEMAGYFPLYLQIACSIVFDQFEEARGLRFDRKEVENLFLEETAPHFDYFWEQTSPEAKLVIRDVIRGRQPKPEAHYLCRQLVRTGYLHEKHQEYRTFSRVFADYLELREERVPPRPASRDVQSEGILESDEKIHQYRIVGKADEGGMGVIYQAQDTTLDRKVALKFIQPRIRSVETTRKRFLHEARSAASLSHPTITSVYELFEHRDQIVMVMEWIEGKSLKKHLLDGGPIDWRRLTSWMIDVCDGLALAHERGIIHRDVKSSNLMIARSGEIRIMDFGLAKDWHSASESLTELTSDGMLLGTLGYMSPEQAKSAPVDGRSDLFSLGVVFFECLTGRLPFHRGSPGATVSAIVSDPMPYLGLYQVENADRIDRVVRKLLEKEPDNRYPNASDLKKDLKKLSRNKGLWEWLG